MSIVRSIIRLAVDRLLPSPRVIYDQDGELPYLSRYYVIGAPTHPSGEPFDAFGNPKPDAVWAEKSWGLYLHHFHRGDQDLELHNHPWGWSVSLILAGGYVEERRGGLGDVVRCVFEPGSLNWIWGNTFHRVELLEDDAWTLFLVGQKSQSWGFWERGSGIFTPWREFINARRESKGADQ